MKSWNQKDYKELIDKVVIKADDASNNINIALERVNKALIILITNFHKAQPNQTGSIFISLKTHDSFCLGCPHISFSRVKYSYKNNELKSFYEPVKNPLASLPRKNQYLKSREILKKIVHLLEAKKNIIANISKANKQAYGIRDRIENALKN